ncbi:MAG: NAD-dependent epimerase/dehydratase family protein [Candidatus Heimdallarchaeota archaeon]
MKILVTGAFGNVGESTLLALLSKDKNYEITGFDKWSPANAKTSRQFRKDISIIWGDLRNPKIVEKAVKGQDFVLHIGAVIPPKANRSEKRTMAINFGGTKNVVDACIKQDKKPKILYTSSVAVYGDIRHKENHCLYVKDPFNPSPGDFYAVTKIKAEEYVRNSGLDFVVFRLSYIPNTKKIELTPLMFKMPLDTPVEFTHTLDTGICLANAIETKEVMGNIYNLGGGEKCQFYYKEYLEKMMPLMGVGKLPDEAFTDDPWHCCFYDTKELNKLLKYQNHTFEDLIQEMYDNTTFKRTLAKIFKPFVTGFLLSLSPYYKKNKKKIKENEKS